MLTNSWVILFLISKGQLKKDTVFEGCLTDDVYWINLVGK
jgi:hypothetical protein